MFCPRALVFPSLYCTLILEFVEIKRSEQAFPGPGGAAKVLKAPCCPPGSGDADSPGRPSAPRPAGPGDLVVQSKDLVVQSKDLFVQLKDLVVHLSRQESGGGVFKGSAPHRSFCGPRVGSRPPLGKRNLSPGGGNHRAKWRAKTEQRRSKDRPRTAQRQSQERAKQEQSKGKNKAKTNQR